MKENGFLVLVDRYKAQIYQYTLYLLGNREDAEDITQETFIIRQYSSAFCVKKEYPMKAKTFSILFFVFVLTGPFGQVWSSPDESLMLYFSFDELNDRTVKDHSQYENDGKLVGNPTLVDGKFGKAMKFNGRTDYVEVPHDDSLTVDKNVTIMAWIKTPRHGGPHGALWQSIVAKGNNPRSYSLYTAEDNGMLRLHVGAQGNGSHSVQHVLLNRWQHVVAQVDSGLHRYWINGKLTTVYPFDDPLPGRADTASVRVGNSHDDLPPVAPDRHFLGLIDELRIYNRALSHDEIVREMNTGNPTAGNTEAAPPESWPTSEKR